MNLQPILHEVEAREIWDELYFIASHMRECDREEIFATRWSDCPRILANDCATVAGLPTSMTLTTRYNDRPAAVCGAVETWPGVWDVWAFGTDDFDKVAIGVTKWVHRVLIPNLLARGLRRAHCRSLFTHYRAHNWLRSFGAEDEVLLKNWGKNGEDFILFEWYREKLLAMYRPMEVR